MITPKILAEGRYQPDDLFTSVSESNRKIDPEIEAQIDSIWEAKKLKAEQEGRTCYNGISYRINSLEVKEGKIHIDFGTLEFKAREALPTIAGYFDLPEEYYRKGCYSGATIRAADNKYLMVELSGKSMNTNTVDVLGGIIEKPTEIQTGEDVFGSLYSELEEEGRIQKSDIDECILRAIYLAAKTNVGFYFEVKLNVTSEELLKRIENETKDQDIKSLKVLTRDEYVSELLTHGSQDKQLMVGFLSL